MFSLGLAPKIKLMLIMIIH